jgi:hypothetical protein
MNDERQITHYIGDACAGGHTQDELNAEIAGSIPKALVEENAAVDWEERAWSALSEWNEAAADRDAWKAQAEAAEAHITKHCTVDVNGECHECADRYAAERHAEALAAALKEAVEWFDDSGYVTDDDTDDAMMLIRLNDALRAWEGRE